MSTETQLAVYDAMVLAIDECYKVDEIKDWRDKALALEEYARQACNMKAEWRAAEVRIRAERKAGQLLKEIQRSKGGQPKKNSPHEGASSSMTEYQRVKEDAHISDKQAERWQQLAALPHGEFEGRLHNPLIKPTTSGIISKYKQPPDDILHLWGIMKDLERDGYLEKDINEMINQMLPKMKLDMKRIMPEVKKWIHKYNGRNKHNRRPDNQDG